MDQYQNNARRDRYSKKKVDKTQAEIDQILLKYKSKFATVADKKIYEHRMHMADIRDRFGELKQCRINEAAMLQYNEYHLSTGITKTPYIKPAENPILQT